MRIWVAAVVIGLLVGADLPAQGEPDLPGRLGTVRNREEPQSPIQRALERREGEAEEEYIETDRDSFTPATTTAGRRRLIVEAAYSFIDNRRELGRHSFPELILRYGLLERLELRLGWNAEMGGTGGNVSGAEDASPPDASGNESTYRISYGVKLRVTDQGGLLPQSSVLLVGATPTAGDVTSTHLTAAYVFGWQLPWRWKADAAIRYGYSFDKGEAINEWMPSAVLRIPVGTRWNVHAEYFGIITQGTAFDTGKHYISPGAHYLITPNLEVGARLGWGLNDQASRFFVNVGGGWRF